jgi:hypothetical protein
VAVLAPVVVAVAVLAPVVVAVAVLAPDYNKIGAPE